MDVRGSEGRVGALGTGAAFNSVFAEILLAACSSRRAFSISSNLFRMDRRCGIVFRLPEIQIKPAELPIPA